MERRGENMAETPAFGAMNNGLLAMDNPHIADEKGALAQESWFDVKLATKGRAQMKKECLCRKLVYIYIYVYMYICIYTCMHAYIHHTSVYYLYIYIYICTYIRTYKYTNIN